jgi:tRNA 2-thiouridine synthesizing protein A
VTIVDARGLACPLPLTMARAKMRELAPGDALTVLATDPEAPIDLAAWAAEEGHHYATRACEGWTEFTIRRAAAGR